jgi:acyl-homoserine-lactone acylase
MPQKILLLVAFLSVTNTLFAGKPKSNNEITNSTGSHFEKIDITKIEIVRDEWGVPHIFADKDHEVAYGLAWANAEDDFQTVQELLLAGQGKSGKLLGKEGAKRDFLLHVFAVKEIVDAEFEQDFTEEYKEYLDGYAQGMNAFAATHPEEVLLNGVFPIEGKDLVYGNVFAACIVSGGHLEVANILKGSYDGGSTWIGSNAMAFSPNKTDDESTILVVNPHMPMEGPFSWYEAHLCSNEGLNILGGLFPGGTSVFLGTNENLGWAHTVNKLDLVDVYKLKMSEDKKRMYEFDGEWFELERRLIILKVKLSNLITVPIPKMTYWSKHGATIRSKDGDFYSVRLAANQKINTIEQIYRMNKAKNFDEFYDALKMEAHPRYNIVYADKEGNIMYLNNGLIPIRNEDYNWTSVLPGDTSSTLWTEFHPIEERPQVINPNCGYVFNTNNTPFNATSQSENLNPMDYPAYFGFEAGDNNRSTRLMELLAEYDKVNLDAAKRMKFDYQLPDSSAFFSSTENFLQLDANCFPDVTESIVKMQNWDRLATKESEAAGMYLLTYDYIFDKLHLGTEAFINGMDVKDSLFVEAVAYANHHLMEYFHTLDVTLGELQVHVRGDKEYGVNGFADVLAANYNTPYTEGRFKTFVADSYVQFAQWKAGEEVTLETLHPYGASNREGSKHYNDQMELYVNQQTKKMTLNKKDIYASAEQIYHPK